MQRPSKAAALAQHLLDLIADEVPCEPCLIELGQLAPQLAGAVWRSHLPDTVDFEDYRLRNKALIQRAALAVQRALPVIELTRHASAAAHEEVIAA